MIQIIKTKRPHLTINRGEYWGRRWVLQIGWWLLLIGDSKSAEPITVLYTNYHGETAHRAIIPHQVWWGSTPYHREPQWLLDVTDCDRNVERTFALADCRFIPLPTE